MSYRQSASSTRRCENSSAPSELPHRTRVRTPSANWRQCCTPTKQPNNRLCIPPFANWVTRVSESPNKGSPKRSTRVRSSPNSKRPTRRHQSSKKASRPSAEMSTCTPATRKQRCSHCSRNSTTLDAPNSATRSFHRPETHRNERREVRTPALTKRNAPLRRDLRGRFRWCAALSRTHLRDRARGDLDRRANHSFDLCGGRSRRASHSRPNHWFGCHSTLASFSLGQIPFRVVSPRFSTEVVREDDAIVINVSGEVDVAAVGRL